MRISTRTKIMAAAAGSAAALAIALPSAAFADNPPPVSTNGQVQVTASITLGLTGSSFTFGIPGAVHSAGDTVGPVNGLGTDQHGTFTDGGGNSGSGSSFTLNVQTGDQAGFVITGQGSDFTRVASSGPGFPIGNSVTLRLAQGNAYSAAPDFNPGTTAANAVTSSGATSLAGDTYGAATSIKIPAAAGNATYQTTLTFAAIAS